MSVRSVQAAPKTEVTGRRVSGSTHRSRQTATRASVLVDGGDSLAPAGPSLALVPQPDHGRSADRPPRAAAVSPSTLRRRQIVADVVAVTTGLLVALALVGALEQGTSRTSAIITATVSGAAWMLCIGMNRLYLSRSVARLAEELQRIGASGLAASGLTMILLAVPSADPPAGWTVTSFCTVTAFLVAERLVARRTFAKMRASGRLRRKVAIIGTDANAQELYAFVHERQALGYDIVGYISVDGRRSAAPPTGRVLGHVTDAERILRETGCVGAMVSLNSVNAVQVNRLARELTDAGFHVALSTSLRDFDATRLRPQAIGGQPLVYLEPTIRGGWRSHAKRAFDVTLACIGLVIGAPIMAVAAIAIRLDSKGPIFFRQVRVGLDGTEFEMIKLRTMIADAEARRDEIADLNESDGPLFKVSDDPRITRVGRFLRRTSIDELPQFWNVLRGDMSVVGPRPALPKEVAGWDDQLRERLRVLPGLTGVWQVSGRSSTSFAEYKRLDLYYVDNWSLLHDVKIVLKTFAVVALQRGAS